MISSILQSQVNILVVEDNIDCLICMIHTLTMFKYSFVTAQYVEPAFYLAKKHLPSLILLDMALPQTSGLNLVKKLKQNKTTKNIPIVIVSAWEKAEAKGAALAAGCDDYIEKPYLLEDLKHKINKYIPLRLASCN